MSDSVEGAVAPFSVGKIRKSRMVFGDIVVEEAVNQSAHSLMYSPSPEQQKARDALMPMDIKFDDNKVVVDSSSSNKSKPKQSSNNQPFDSVIESNETMKENVSKGGPTVEPNANAKHLPVGKSSKTAQRLPEKRTKQQRSALRRDLGQKTQAAINNATESINETLNAARQAKKDLRREKVKKTSKTRIRWKDEQEEALAFNAEAEKMRHEQLALQRQMSSIVYKAKAKSQLNDKQAHLDAIDKESHFKSDVFRDHQQKLKQEQERKRRASIEARAKLRQNHRAGVEKMRMMAIEEDQIVMEERHLGSVAGREYERQEADKRRKSFSFRNGDARRIRQLHAEMEKVRMAKEHESYELKWAGEKDAEAYKRQLAQQRRDSLAFRNKEGHRQRKEESERRSKELEAEHASYELKWAAERDAEDYKKQMADERRDSLAFRNQEGRAQRLLEANRRAEEEHNEHLSYELKWAAERDAEAYKKQMADERRDSFAFRNEEGRRQRQEEQQRRSAEQAEEHASYELKWDGERDAENYKRQMEEERRNSLAFRNKQKKKHQEIMEELQAIAHQKETESLALKWAGEDDAKAYIAELEEQRRQSLHFRNLEGRRHRKLDDEAHAKAVQAAHEEEELQAACREDVQQYKKECEARDRASLVFRGKESQLHRLQEENERQAEREIEEKNRELEDKARADVTQYLEDCRRRRRMSLAFRAKEKRHHAKLEKKQRELEREERHRNTNYQAMDRRYVELARQQEQARIAMDAIRHAGCTFSGKNPFAAILE